MLGAQISVPRCARVNLSTRHDERVHLLGMPLYLLVRKVMLCPMELIVNYNVVTPISQTVLREELLFEVTYLYPKLCPDIWQSILDTKFLQRSLGIPWKINPQSPNCLGCKHVAIVLLS